jgi:hypothetical protein
MLCLSAFSHLEFIRKVAYVGVSWQYLECIAVCMQRTKLWDFVEDCDAHFLPEHSQMAWQNFKPHDRNMCDA